MSWRLKKGVQHNDSVSTHVVIITKSVKVWKNGISKEWFFFLFDLEKLTQSIFLHSSVEALNWTLTQLDCLFYILTDTDTHIVKSQLQTKTEIHCVVGLLCTFMFFYSKGTLEIRHYEHLSLCIVQYARFSCTYKY